MADSGGRAWDWCEDADDVVVKAQPAIAIYPGPAGVVIRRQGDWNDDDDDVIWFGVDQARGVATAILKAAGLDPMAQTPESAQVVSEPKDSTAAERQRRRRARQRDQPTLDIDRDQARDVTAEDRDIDRDIVTGDGGAA